MAKQAKKTSPRRSVAHVKVVCPQCGKRVNVPSQLGLGQQSYPCPSCRVPISRSLIEAEVAASQQEAAEATAEETPGERVTG